MLMTYYHKPLDQAQIDFENEGGETYICGNPPYKGTKNQTNAQKEDLQHVFSSYTNTFKALDYVAAWFFKAAQYGEQTNIAMPAFAFQLIQYAKGVQVPLLWPLIFARGNKILFAHTSFLWRNLASHNAGVTVAIVGFGIPADQKRRIYSEDKDRQISVREAENINAYLVPSRDIIVSGSSHPINALPKMSLGNQPYEGNYLIMDPAEFSELSASEINDLTKDFYGSSEFIRGGRRKCLWLSDSNLGQALINDYVRQRIDSVRAWRLASDRPGTRAMASRSHQFCEMNFGHHHTIVVPIRSSEIREYLPVGILNERAVVSNLAYALYDAPTWCLAIIASRVHLSWIGAVCGRMKSDYSYSNKMGWHTFPIPTLTEKHKADLTRCAEDILLTRESHFPATIAELYDPQDMPADLREAHDRNDEVLERIYIGRRFKNDTERLEKLFELYTKMSASQGTTKKKAEARA